jgi:transcriptional regulator with XRE-family HTH domain
MKRHHARSETVPQPSSFAARLRQLRKRTGISAYRLAKMSGLSPQAVNRLEAGEREPTWNTVQRLADVLSVSTEDFRG